MLLPKGQDLTVELLQAEELYRNGNIRDASKLLVPLVSGPSEHPDAQGLLALCELRLGFPAQALMRLARAHALAPEDPLLMLRYGITLMANGHPAAAATQFRACLQMLPEDPAPAINLAASRLEVGDAAGALQAAQEACKRDSGSAAAQNALGRALLALNRPAEAVTCFRSALTHLPEQPEIWLNLAMAAYRAGQLAPAIAASRRALTLAPGHGGATATLASLLRLAGDVEAATELLAPASAAAPAAPELRLARATTMLQDEQPCEALALLADCPTGSPALVAHWRLARALALLQLKQPNAARRELDQLGAVPPHLAVAAIWRRVLLAHAEGDIQAAETEADAMERMLSDNRTLLPESRIMAWFDLARFWAGRGATDRAFLGWTNGHRALSSFQPFSRVAWRGFVDASIAHFDAERLHAGPRATNSDPAPVFIVGMPRSGTTLLEQILAAHPSVHAAGERPSLPRAFAALGAGREDATGVERIAACTSAEFDQAATAYLSDLHALAPHAARVADKLPGNFARLGLVALLLPGARIIHCARDPRDVGLSIFTHRFYGEHAYAHDLSDLGWYIGQYARLMDHWLDVLPNPILTVRLQDWITDFRGTLLRTLAFLDLPYHPACTRFWEFKRPIRTVSRNQVMQPVNAAGLGRWKTYARFLTPLLEELEEAGLLGDET